MTGTAKTLGPRVRDLVEGQPVDTILCVRERERRSRRNGSDYLRFVLADRTGTVQAVAWDGVDELFETAAPGMAIRVRGRFAVDARYGPQLKIEALRPARDEEYRSEDLAEGPQLPVERLEADLRALIATVQDGHLKALLDRLFGKDAPMWPRFRDAPAAKYYHQAYRHGLLEHTLSVAQAVSAAAASFPAVSRDVAVTGALLHDIGKTEAYNDDIFAIDLTDLGRLQGEIPLGYFLVRSEVERIAGFPPDLAQAILHIVLSHHGLLKYGSPVQPATREAALVHAIDNLGGKLGSFDRLEKGLQNGEAWSRFDQALEGSAYFGQRAA
jgi:3'-5' exoribonuclease